MFEYSDQNYLYSITCTARFAALIQDPTKVYHFHQYVTPIVCRRFLNRLLGLPVARQNLLFNYFAATLTAEIEAERAEGRYNEGFCDLPTQNIERQGDPTGMHTLTHC